MSDPVQTHTEMNQLQEQVATLEQLLVTYEQSAVEQNRQLQAAMSAMQTHTNQLQHAESTLGTLQAILGGMGEAVFVADSLGKPLFVNPAASQILGLDLAAPDLYKWVETCQVCLPDAVTPYTWAQFPLSLALSGVTVDSAEMFVATPATATAARWLSANAGPLKDADGVLMGGIVAFRDATQRKHNEAALLQSKTQLEQQAQQLEMTLSELKQAQLRLVQAEKMAGLERVVAGIAHEINNPVNFIVGNLIHAERYFHDMLALIALYQRHFPETPEAVADFIEEIDLSYVRSDCDSLLQSMQNGAERIEKVVQSLRNFSRLDEATVKTVDLHEGLDNALMILGKEIQRSTHRDAIAVVRDYGDLPQVQCFAAQLNQVFLHILDNAIHALDSQRLLPQQSERPSQRTESPTIWISTSLLESDRIRVDIVNNGPAIPDAVRNRLFDPFFTTKSVGEGTGMGLSISYQIVVDQHRGSLECLSRPEQVTFRIEIPCRILMAQAERH
ncbi:MAG: ATP-binding protein [Cyanobacteria bacterium P01_H01_bin.119]